MSHVLLFVLGLILIAAEFFVAGGYCRNIRNGCRNRKYAFSG